MMGIRYITSHLLEDQTEPGSGRRVLRNLLGIKSQREMDQVEAQELKRTEDVLFRTYDQSHRFTASDISRMHKLWLGKVYGWAGRYRHVKLSKGNFSFAFPAQIPQLMRSLEKGPLQRYTPCRVRSREGVVKALAEVHAEMVLIHPFREGNGRIARTLATLMALQARLPPLDFSPIQGKKRDYYFAAVRAGLEQNYRPMEQVFRWVLQKSLSGRSLI